MSRQKRTRPTIADDEPVEPLPDCEQAWFWFARCQRLRRDGARFERDAGRVRRPCNPDDIYRIVMRLYRADRLQRRHVVALARFGALERAPDPRVPEERGFDRDWREALDGIGPNLVAKGIVENNVETMNYTHTRGTPSPCRN